MQTSTELHMFAYINTRAQYMHSVYHTYTKITITFSNEKISRKLMKNIPDDPVCISSSAHSDQQYLEKADR